MLKLFKTLFKVGEATSNYPFSPRPVSDGFRGRPELNAERCIACAACTMACPANALSMETNLEEHSRTWSLFLGRCIFCGRCEEVCPTHAVALTSDFELAVSNKQDLYQKARFALQDCRVCSRPFTSVKELNYAMALTVQAGVAAEEVEAMRSHFETCPECKRKQSVLNPAKAPLGKYLNEGMPK